MIKKGWLIILVVVVLAFSLVGCGGGGGTQPPANGDNGNGEEPAFDGEILIGIMLPMTGSEAYYGGDMENAIKLAVDEINAAGGILGKKVVTTTGDDGCDPQMAANAAQMLSSREVVAVVGGFCSGATLNSLAIYNDAQIPLVIAASNSTQIIAENQGWAFMVNSPGFHQAASAVGLFENLGKEKLAIVHMGDGFSEDLANLTRQEWEAKGGEVVLYDAVNRGEQDFAALVTRIRSAGAEVVYWTAYHAEGAFLVRQLREGGFDGDIVVGDGSSSIELLELAGPASEGVYCTSPPIVDFLPAAQNFIASYTSRFNQAPGAYSGLAYDSMRLLANAIEQAGSTDPEAIKNVLAGTRNFPTLAGNISFTSDLTLAESNFIIIKAEDGKWIFADF